MSQARFDTGQQLCWLPLGIYSGGQSVAAGDMTLIDLITTPDLYYRIDYASLTLRFLNVADISAWAEMVVTTGMGTDIPILTESAAWADGTYSIPLGYPHTYTQQLSLPFYVGAECTIKIRGGSAVTVASNYAGLVAVSYAYAFGP